ncbi:acyl-CoA synthetase [Maricurvus nonylphenolicus]|uniref:acyl-CoA synthetase n=1 Tax=Maricurvus nonylphenolicus TaxID=1008307 RepID=UPI0036F422B0
MMNALDIRISDEASIEAIEKTPITDRIDSKSTYEAISKTANVMPDAPAIHWMPKGFPSSDDKTYSYNQLFAKVTQAANLFRSIGVERNIAISFILPNLPETHAIIWGGEAAGIVNPINPFLEVDHIVSILEAAQSHVLITVRGGIFDDYAKKAQQAADRVSRITKRYYIDWVPGSQVDFGEDFLQACDSQPGNQLNFELDAELNDISSYLHTGGTTGAPKLAQHTHGNQLKQSWMMACTGNIGPETIFAAGLPLFHANAYRMSGIMIFATGASIVLMGPSGYRDPAVVQNFWKTVDHYRVTTFLTVPTIYSALLEIPQTNEDTSSLTHAYSGTAPIAIETIKRFHDRFGIHILEGWGLTEATCASTGNPLYGEKKIGSIGLRMPYQEIRVVILDDDGQIERDCETNETGVLILSGPNIIQGYKQTEFNADLFPAENWLNTGDLGYKDEDGYFYISGRKKDLIIRGGHNIDPAMIEAPLSTHPDVALCASVGKPDSRLGEMPVAYVTLRPNASSTGEDIQHYIAEKISERAAIPKIVVVIDTMPLTGVGKISKIHLRGMASESALEEALRDRGVDTSDFTFEADCSGHRRMNVTITTGRNLSDPERAQIEDILHPFIVDHTIVESI